MTRTKARELAVRLIYAQGASDEDAGEVLDGFFDEEHFTSLAGEDELFASAPDEVQRAYIQRLVSACAEHRDELDNIIARYSEGWRPERISRTAAALLRCALAEIAFLKDEDVTPAVAHIQYIAAGSEGRACGALDLLFATLIDGRFADRRYLDFGISTEQGGTLLNEGLIFQKEGFGGRAVCYDTYTIKL